MNVSGASSYINSIATLATDAKASQMGSELSTAILKQIMDQQKMMMEALTEMISQTPSPDSNVGQNIDLTG